MSYRKAMQAPPIDPDRVRGLQDMGLTNVEIGKRLGASRAAILYASRKARVRREHMDVVQPATRPAWRDHRPQDSSTWRDVQQRIAEIRAVRSLVE